MPTHPKLFERDLGYLTQAIRKFGGYPEVAEALGYLYAGRRSWSTVEDLRPHLDPIVAELGHMPSTNVLRARKREDLVHAIIKFGRSAQVARQLGYKHEGYESWTRVEDLRRHLDPIVERLGRMPTDRELHAAGLGNVAGSMRKFGGLRKVAEALGYPYEGYKSWRSVEDLRPHLAPIVRERGRMPTIIELKGMGRFDLINAVGKFGGQSAVAEALGYPPAADYKLWEVVEDLHPHLDPIVAELERMPTANDLLARGRADLVGAVRKFGGHSHVAEALGYPYPFASALEQRARLQRLESALVQLHGAQLLSAGQVMVILRHAGLLSKGNWAHLMQRLHAVAGGSAGELGVQLSAIADSVDEPGQEGSGVEGPDFGPWSAEASPLPTDELPGAPARSAADGGSSADDVATPAAPVAVPGDSGRDREAEVKERRGWSAVGNLIDPTPALLQLGVTRLKTAFYRFAHGQRGSLAVPARPPTPEEVGRLKSELREAAFGEYGELVDNALVREACEAYAADLAEALLLPRSESEKVPRLYQLDGARFLARRLGSADRPYGLLFDQPGMGKTLTTLWALAAAGATRFLIVAPLTVKRQVWTLDALRAAFPRLEEAQLATDLPSALELPESGPAVTLLHYEELRRHEAVARLAAPRSDGSLPFDALVFDEAHEVKERLSTESARGPTKQGAWLLRRGARACVGMTATPVVNELYEPVSLLHLAQGRRESDAGRRLQSRRLRDRVDVMEYLLEDSLRRLKTDVLPEIPPRRIQAHPVTPDAGQLERIREFLNRGRRAVAAALSGYRRLMLEVKLEWIAGAVSARQAAVSPKGLPHPKVLVLCYNVEGISKRVYSRLVDELGAERVLHVDGTTPQDERDEALRRFRAPADAASGVVALVGTVGTVGVGVTLFDEAAAVTPHRVVFADLPFTWAEFEQGVDRLHRVGQKYPVQVDVPLASYGEQLTQADGEPLLSFDGWVWDWICRKQILADQVLDAAFNISEYKDSAVRRAIARALKATEDAGGAVIAPPPPADSEAAEHRRLLGRYRGLPRARAAELFGTPGASHRFLATNDASPSARLAQRLVRERLARWLDRRSIVVDLGCGSNPLRALPCSRVTGIDRHGVNGGLIGDSAATGLPAGEADFVVMSLSMWGTPEDRLSYLREAKRILRPLGKLIIVEPSTPFGGVGAWKSGAGRLGTVLGKLGMRLAEPPSEHTVDVGTSLVAFVIDNSSTPAVDHIDASLCVWADA